MRISSPTFGNECLRLDPRERHTQVHANPAMTCDLSPVAHRSILVDAKLYSSETLEQLPFAPAAGSHAPSDRTAVVRKCDPLAREAVFLYSRPHDIAPDLDERKLRVIQRLVSSKGGKGFGVA